MIVDLNTANQSISSSVPDLATALINQPSKSPEEIEKEEEQKKQEQEEAQKRREQEQKEQEKLNQQQQDQLLEPLTTNPLDTALTLSLEAKTDRTQRRAVDEYKAEDRAYFEDNREQAEQLIEKLAEPLQERIFEGALQKTTRIGTLEISASADKDSPFTSQNELINESKLNELGFLLERYEVKTNPSLKRKIEAIYTRIEALIRQSSAEDQAFVAYAQEQDDTWADALLPKRPTDTPFTLAA